MVIVLSFVRGMYVQYTAYLFTVLYLESIFIANKSLLFYLMPNIIQSRKIIHFIYLLTVVDNAFK